MRVGDTIRLGVFPWCLFFLFFLGDVICMYMGNGITACMGKRAYCIGLGYMWHLALEGESRRLCIYSLSAGWILVIILVLPYDSSFFILLLRRCIRSAGVFDTLVFIDILYIYIQKERDKCFLL